MIKRYLKFFIFFIFMINGFTIELNGLSEKIKTINILLEKDVTEALVEVKGGYYVYNPYDGSKISSGLIGKRFIIRPIDNGIKWGGSFPDVNQITIAPKSKDISILVNGIQYDGKMTFSKFGDKLTIVNEINIESYLKSILTDQFPIPLEKEVMSAVAIAARTTSYYNILKNKDAFWHINAKDVNYNGSALILSNSSIVDIIDSTKDMILVNKKEDKEHLFIACWHDNSAGKTASYNSIFANNETDIFPKNNVFSNCADLNKEDCKWEYFISKEKLADLLEIRAEINEIEVCREKDSSKVYSFKIKTEEEIYDIDFFAFQEKIGIKNILSNDISNVFMKNNKIEFYGYGKGHGVGLCLYSASVMAQNGDIAVNILEKFFPTSSMINFSSKLA